MVSSSTPTHRNRSVPGCDVNAIEPGVALRGLNLLPHPFPQVNLDAETREALLKAMDSVGADRFNEAQQRIYSLMAKDSFPRFLRSSQRTEAITAF